VCSRRALTHTDAGAHSSDGQRHLDAPRFGAGERPRPVPALRRIGLPGLDGGSHPQRDHWADSPERLEAEIRTDSQPGPFTQWGNDQGNLGFGPPAKVASPQVRRFRQSFLEAKPEGPALDEPGSLTG